MPRPLRAQGRPGTRVVPVDWQTSHSIPVGKTQTGMCVIRAQGSGDTVPVMNDDLTYTAATPAGALYSGSCRVQAMKTRDTTAPVGEQDQSLARYLVGIDIDAPFIPVGSVVEVTTSDDPALNTPRRLIVRFTEVGTLRFERDLYCVDDMTRVIS